MRSRYMEANLMTLDTANPTAPVLSDKLFQGMFASKMLVPRLLLEITIVATGGTVTVGSLGDVTLMSSAGNEFTVPLHFLAQALPYVGCPVHTRAITNGNVYTIPIPFESLIGQRPKDSYLVSEKCKDYYIQVTGRAEAGLTYTTYTVKPYMLGERNRKISLPSYGYLKYTNDDIPANTWHETKLKIKGASWCIIAQSDYADFDANDKMRLTVDGEVAWQCDDVRRLNRAFASELYSRNAKFVADAIPDCLIVLPLTFDRKLAKISRGSDYTIDFQSNGEMTLMALWQELRGMNTQDSLETANRQGLDKIINPTDPRVTISPVDSTGHVNPAQKPLYRKIYVKQAEGQFERLNNAI